MKTSSFIRNLLIIETLCFIAFDQISFSQDKLVGILYEEVQREFQTLKQQEVPCYYISYRVDEISGYLITASFGALTYSQENKSRLLTVAVRVGSPQLDNFHSTRDYSIGYGGFSSISLPSDEEPVAVKQFLWNATNEAYQQAVKYYSNIKSDASIKVEEEDKTPDFTIEKPNVYLEPLINIEDVKLDIPFWENRTKKYSSAFLKDSAIITGTSNFVFRITRKYFISSEGDKITQNNISTSLLINGNIKAQDGMEMPLYKSYFAYKPDELPSDEVITKEVDVLIKNLILLKNAPVAEPYSGPSLLTGKASGVFFHEIFGHRVEGERIKNENDAQTFKKKVNQQVLPADFNVYCDPQIINYEDQKLNGHYIYDDQGTKGRRVDVVKNGVLKDFLMSRTPIDGFSKSNGHGRAMVGMQPVSRQSNLIIETSEKKTQEELRNELIKLVKEQNKSYGYLFDEVVGGFTMTTRYMPNAFNVTPTLVYRVYTDGRPDEIVRGVDLIGTPLSIFSQIDQAGGKTEIFNGYCGAESGSIPVSCASPMILVKNIETQKKNKSQERPNILPRPDSNELKTDKKWLHH
jgi:TldD protein